VLRISKAHGGTPAAQQVAYEWAMSMPPEEGGALLRRLGLGEAAVEAAVEAAAFDHAFQLAQARGGGATRVGSQLKSARQHRCHALQPSWHDRQQAMGDAARGATRIRITEPPPPNRTTHPQAAAPHRLAEVHLKHAMFLEDNGHFAEAEGGFVAAGATQAGIPAFRASSAWRGIDARRCSKRQPLACA
jgi:intraflagellar transport protein 172